MIECVRCNYFLPKQSATKQTVGHGECRRRPPIHSRFVDNDARARRAAFPMVHDSDWCGEFVEWPATLGHSHDDEANAAFDAALQDDATGASRGANGGKCQTGRANATHRQTLGTPPETKRQ